MHKEIASSSSFTASSLSSELRFRTSLAMTKGLRFLVLPIKDSE